MWGFVLYKGGMRGGRREPVSGRTAGLVGLFFLPQNAAVNFDSRKTKQLMKQLRKNVCETMDTEVRTVIYTTNAIESLNATYRKLNRQRSVFPSDQALLKALYLSTFEATKKWTMPLRNWGRVYGELQIMYEGRLPE